MNTSYSVEMRNERRYGYIYIHIYDKVVAGIPVKIHLDRRSAIRAARKRLIN